VALQWFTRVKYMTDVPITYGFGALLVSEDALRGADPADLETLQRVCRKHSKLLVDKTRVQNDEAVQSIRSEGVKLLAVDPAARNTFFTTARGAWNDGVGKLYPEDLLRRVTALVDDYRANHKEARANP
jgi:TRAP-type C4-dicarboxylate transport system substrate-binding protein